MGERPEVPGTDGRKLAVSDLIQRGSPRRSSWLPSHPLVRELVIVMLIKVVALGLIWWAFFSGHQAPADSGAVADRITESRGR